MTSDGLIATLREQDDVCLVVMRGLPGSGKSTFARRLVGALGFVLIEADAHFYDAQGTYRFDPARVADAHAVCQQHADAALREGQRVVIGNTNVRLWEIAPYVGLAHMSGCGLRIVHCHGNWENVHAVGAATIAKMREKWEALPPQLVALELNLHDAPPSNPNIRRLPTL